MTSDSARVAIILSGDVEPHLSEFAQDRPVWVMRTSGSEGAVAALRSEGREVTDFVADEDSEASLLGIVPLVDEHHGSASGRTLTGLDVVGAPITARVRERLLALGFSRIRPTGYGFAAERP